MSKSADKLVRKYELRVFLFLTVVLFPVLSISLMGGYGFIIWMTQILFGPPGV